jgi:hypothetical protein
MQTSMIMGGCYAKLLTSAGDPRRRVWRVPGSPGTNPRNCVDVPLVPL